MANNHPLTGYAVALLTGAYERGKVLCATCGEARHWHEYLPEHEAYACPKAPVDALTFFAHPSTPPVGTEGA